MKLNHDPHEYYDEGCVSMCVSFLSPGVCPLLMCLCAIVTQPPSHIMYPVSIAVARGERERERCCHVRTLWPEQLLTNTISLPCLTSSASASVCIPLSLSLSLSLSVVVCLSLSLSFSFLPCVFLSPHRETFHRTWILASVLFGPLWRESVFDLGISKCFVSDVH